LPIKECIKIKRNLKMKLNHKAVKTSIVKELVESSNNSNLEIKVFAKSGQIPTNNCFDKIINATILSKQYI